MEHPIFNEIPREMAVSYVDLMASIAPKTGDRMEWLCYISAMFAKMDCLAEANPSLRHTLKANLRLLVKKIEEMPE
jgi:hypothetical protein